MKRTIALTKALTAEFETAVTKLRALTQEMEHLIATREVDDAAQIEMTARVRHVLDTFFEEPDPELRNHKST